MSSFAISNLSHPYTNAPGLNSPTQFQNGSWQGRIYSWSLEKIEIVSKGITSIAYAILFPLNLIFANTWATSSICKKLNQNVLPMIEQFKGLPNHYSKFSILLESSFNIINTVQIAEDIDFFFNGKFKNHSLTGVAAKILLGVGHVLEGLAWFSRIGLISSLSFGNTLIFSLVGKSNIVKAVNGTLAFTPAFFATDTLCRIPSARNEALKKSLMFELAKHMGDLTLSLMMLAGRMSVANLGIIGLTCIGLEILNLIYKERYENTIP